VNAIQRRNDHRQPIMLDAIVHPERGRTWPCNIRDFAVGGMLLVGEAGSTRTLYSTGFNPQPGDVVHIHFSVPNAHSTQNFRISAEVARVVDNGLGVRFPDGLAARAFTALQEFSLRDASGGVTDPRQSKGGLHPTLIEADAAHVRRELRRLIERGLPQMLGGFFERARDELSIRARESRNREQQDVLLAAMRKLETEEWTVTRQTVADVLAQVEHSTDLRTLKARRASRGQSGGSELSLVATEDFEDWLLVADVISRAESRFGEELHELGLRLGMVAPAWSEKDALPIGPTVLAVAFDDALAGLELDREARKYIFPCFRNILIAFLRKFYPVLRKLLADSGLFPPLEDLAMAASQRRQPAAVASPPAAVPVAEPQSPPAPPAGEFTQQFAMPAAAIAAARAEAAAMEQQAARSALLQPPTAHRSRPGRGTLRPVGNVYGAARELMHLQRGLPGPDGLPTEAPWSDEIHPAPETIFGEAEILAALDRLAEQRQDEGERLPLRRQLAKELGLDGERSLAPQQRDAFEVVEGLLESIRDDDYLPHTFNNWVDQLEITYNKLAAENSDFLDTSQAPMHAALRLLDGLAELSGLADAGDGMEPSIQQPVDRLLAQVERDYDGGPAVFEHALEDLEPLVSRARRLFDGNLKRTVHQSEGTHRLVRARRAVLKELEVRLTGRRVPELLLKLLNPGWRNLLVHSHLRHGVDSPEWRRQLELVDNLVNALDGDTPGEEQIKALMHEVAEGLESIAFEPGRRRPLLDGLRASLSGERTAGAEIALDSASAPHLLGLSGAMEDDGAAPDSINDEAGLKAWARWLERARDLDVGSWLSEQEDDGRSRVLTVAWIGERHSAFALTNRRGVKVHDCDLGEMVARLHDGRFTIVDEIDQPLTERASQRMLQNMHNQLAYQATHDALTGLMNRKEYERRVEQAVVHAEALGSEHVVLFFDLDQFKVINNTSGHDAGDELLRALVPALRHELRGVRASMARLGGDEFGILLERCSHEDGLELAQRLRRSVADFRFDWAEREYALTTSIGFVAFRNDGRSAPTLLQQADAACYAAKDGGRNRVQVFEVTDERLAARQGVMEWVSEVDRVLKEGRIRLTAQRIAPIGNHDAPSHYEFLMTVLSTEGKPMPPMDFITAAETYGRMPAVDRWVVAHALEWMAENPGWLSSIQGMSINLSGTSLNDEGFLEYVLETLEQSGVPPAQVTFEITETATIASMEGARRFMQRLREVGCTFSLDDFGTGLASYSYLRNLEVDYVKIDGIFVKDMVDNPADFAVVKSVNEIAHFMGKQTIAEFVESDAILERLREIGVDYAQGWGIERPKPLADLLV